MLENLFRRMEITRSAAAEDGCDELEAVEQIAGHMTSPPKTSRWTNRSRVSLRVPCTVGGCCGDKYSNLCKDSRSIGKCVFVEISRGIIVGHLAHLSRRNQSFRDGVVVENHSGSPFFFVQEAELLRLAMRDQGEVSAFVQRVQGRLLRG